MASRLADLVHEMKQQMQFARHQRDVWWETYWQENGAKEGSVLRYRPEDGPPKIKPRVVVVPDAEPMHQKSMFDEPNHRAQAIDRDNELSEKIDTILHGRTVLSSVNLLTAIGILRKALGQKSTGAMAPLVRQAIGYLESKEGGS